MTRQIAHITQGLMQAGAGRLGSAAVLALLALPYLVNLHASSIWDANEAFYAVTPLEMMERGDYGAPTFNYEVRAQKPPLTYWAVLASYAIAGISELSVRLPGFLALFGVLCFVCAMGRNLAGPAAGLIAAGITATSLRIFVLARKLPIDTILLFWLAGAAYFLVRAAMSGGRRPCLAAYACMGFGFLTKGPVAVVIPGGSYLLWLLLARRFTLRALRPAEGLAVLAAIVVPWYAWTYVTQGWTYILPFFFRDNLGRFVSETFGPSRGAFYYVWTFLGDFFPWSILSVAAVWAAWRGFGGARLVRSLELGFPLVWCGFVLVLFSFSRNKQEYYIASAYPMMALFLAVLFARSGVPGAGEGRSPGPVPWRGAFACAGILLAAVALAFPVAAARVLPGLDAPLRHLPPFLLFAGAVWLILSTRTSGPIRGLTVLIATLWCAMLAAAWIYVPALERLRPVRALCRMISERASPGDEVGYFRATAPSMAFYLRRPIFEEYHAEPMLRRLQSGRAVYCIMGGEDLNELQRTGSTDLQVIARSPRLQLRLRQVLGTGGPPEELILVSNRPYAGTRSEARR